MPEGQGCCGALHVHSGLPQPARALARRNIDAVLGGNFDAIITNAAGCGSTLKEYGELLEEDAAYAAKAREFSAKMRVNSSPMDVPGGMKSLFYSTDHDVNSGALVRPDWLGLLDPYYERPLAIRQLFTAGSTSSDTIEYVRVDTVTNNAAPVPEAISNAVIGDGTVANRSSATPISSSVRPRVKLDSQ